MAGNCPYWKDKKCAGTNNDFHTYCGLEKLKFKNCPLYKMIIIKLAGGTMEDQLKGANLIGGAMIGGSGRHLSDEELEKITARKTPHILYVVTDVQLSDVSQPINSLKDYFDIEVGPETVVMVRCNTRVARLPNADIAYFTAVALSIAKEKGWGDNFIQELVMKEIENLDIPQLSVIGVSPGQKGKYDVRYMVAFI